MTDTEATTTSTTSEQVEEVEEVEEEAPKKVRAAREKAPEPTPLTRFDSLGNALPLGL